MVAVENDLCNDLYIMSDVTVKLRMQHYIFVRQQN